MYRNLNGLVLAAGMVFAATGCNLKMNGDNEVNPTVVALAKTALQQTATAKAQTAALDTRDAPPETAIALSPTASFTPTLTPTVTPTPTSDRVTVTVSKNTNCRTGPDKIFDLVGIMMVGETAEAIGRNEQKTYWVIRLPANTAKQCWLWYEWATVTGNGDALPVIQSPPTPTFSPKPDFTFSFVRVENCGSSHFLVLRIQNTGNMAWESRRAFVKDLTTAHQIMSSGNQFATFSACVPSPISPSIRPAETLEDVVNAPDDPTHHSMHVELTMCTADSMGGTCLSKDLDFTIP
ncbi:MAG: hypothetical protein WBM17_16385 [Anaerolineales bacterium]